MTNPQDNAAMSSPVVTSDMLVSVAPSFSVASLMISSAQSQARAIEASVAHVNHGYFVGLATATQCVTKVLGEPSDQLRRLNAMIAANELS